MKGASFSTNLRCRLPRLQGPQLGCDFETFQVELR